MDSTTNPLKQVEVKLHSRPKAPTQSWARRLINEGVDSAVYGEMKSFTADLDIMQRRNVYMNLRRAFRRAGGDMESAAYKNLKLTTGSREYRKAKYETVMKKNTVLQEWTEEMMEEAVERAIAYIRDESVDTVHSKANALRMVEALCLLTGRRKWEIIKTMTVRSVPFETYQAEVGGLCKSNASCRIPLLAPIATVINGIVKVRQNQNLKPGSYATRSIFGKSMKHSTFRDIYATLGYQRRHDENHFELSSSPSLWRSRALGIHLTTAALHYNVVTVSTEKHAPVQPGFSIERGAEVACSAGGSSEYL